MKKVSGDLPIGWKKIVEGSDGKIIYVNIQKNIQSFTDPRLAYAQEELSNGPLRQRFDASSTAMSVLHGKDLSKCVTLITGCNAGIGLETARWELNVYRSLYLHANDFYKLLNYFPDLWLCTVARLFLPAATRIPPWMQ